VFVNSMSDLFHEKLSDDDIRRVFNVMEEARRHTFQVLTKRPHRMHEFVDDYFRWRSPEGTEGVSPPSNIWLGVSAENQATADERIPLLLQTPAAIRFVSAEPLLGPIDFDSSDKDGLHALGCGYEGGHRACPESPQRGTCAGLDWVIVGGESGPGARPMQTDWAVSIRDQCVAAGVPYFFKQWGEWGDDGGDGLMRVGKKRAGRLLDGRTWDEFPPSATPASAETGRP
jgi:protein gp37